MKNIFYISGYKSNTAIARILGDAIRDDIQLQNLESTLSDSATTYINNIWQDSTLGTKLKLKISRDSAGKYKIQTSITSERETNGIYSLEDISDEKTHNQKFVAHVESYMPNWKLYRKELNSLTFE